MTKTSYYPLNAEVRQKVAKSREDIKELGIEYEIETEMVMDDWRRRIHDGHIYASDGIRYQILARKIPRTKRIFVALHDKEHDVIYAANLEAGPIQGLAANARALVPPDTRFDLNTNWRG